MGATTMPSPQNAIALPRSRGGKASSITACESGCKAPPVAPCTTRKAIKTLSDGAMPQRTEAAVNPNTAVIRMRLRPKRLASHPVMGKTTALATR